MAATNFSGGVCTPTQWLAIDEIEFALEQDQFDSWVQDVQKIVAKELGGLFVKCDVSNEEHAAEAVAAASEMGPLRVLVNSAGIGFAARTIDRNNEPMQQAHFDFVIKVNLLGTFNMLRQSAAAMAKIQAHAESEIAAAAKNERATLKTYAADLALKIAEDKLRGQLNTQADAGLIQNFLKGLN